MSRRIWLRAQRRKEERKVELERRLETPLDGGQVRLRTAMDTFFLTVSDADTSELEALFSAVVLALQSAGVDASLERADEDEVLEV